MASLHAAGRGVRCVILLLQILLCASASGRNGRLEIPDLGRGSSIGSLYDAVQDDFLDVVLWPDSLTSNPELVKTVPADFSSLAFTNSEKLEDRARLQEVEAEVTAGILAGLLSIKGSIKYLEHKRFTRSTAEVLANYHIETRRVTINTHDPQLCDQQLQVREYPGLARATHVVTGIVYGGDCAAIFSAESRDSYEKVVDIKKIEAEIDYFFGTATETIHDDEDVSESSDTYNNISVEIFGDVLAPENLPTDVKSAVLFMQSMPALLVDADLPKRIFLTPLTELFCEAGRRLQSSEPSPELLSLPSRFLCLIVGQHSTLLRVLKPKKEYQFRFFILAQP